MAFERSASGQENRSVFLGVDATCYVEGHETDQGGGVDAVYWAKIFRTFRPELRVRFLPRGGKPILESLANSVISDNLRGVLVAMDADYDRVTSDLIVDKRILYTWGYSIENDLFCSDNLEIAFCALAHCPGVPGAISEFIRGNEERVGHDLRFAIYADHLSLQAKSSLFPRESPGRVIARDPVSSSPVVRKDEIRKLCSEVIKQTNPRGPIRIFQRLNYAEHCVGHIVALVSAYILRSAMKLSGKRNNQSFEHIRDICLQTFPSALMRPSAMAVHYQTSLLQL